MKNATLPSYGQSFIQIGDNNVQPVCDLAWKCSTRKRRVIKVVARTRHNTYRQMTAAGGFDADLGRICGVL